MKKLKQSFKQYRNIFGKHYMFYTANNLMNGFVEEKIKAKNLGLVLES
jgi:hypothetical protein